MTKNKENFLISIKDQGKGINKEQQKHLFKPFYQVQDSPQGLGLGLYIVKSIIELHKGKIWIQSEYGKGSTFFISLPAGLENVRKSLLKKLASRAKTKVKHPKPK